MESTILVRGCCWNSLQAPRSQQLVRLDLVSPRSSTCANRVSSSFSGQKLIKRYRIGAVSYGMKQLRVGTARAHSAAPTPGVPGAPHEEVAFLDDMSRYIYKKISVLISPYLPKHVDYLDWLPEGLHKKLHNSEAAATVVLREMFHFGLFYFLFVLVDGFCKWLHWLYNVSMKEKQDTTDESYQTSTFHVMTGPFRLLIVVWAVTRLIHVCAPLIRVNPAVGKIARIRETAMVVAVTWFLFNWKQKYVKPVTALTRQAHNLNVVGSNPTPAKKGDKRGEKKNAKNEQPTQKTLGPVLDITFLISFPAWGFCPYFTKIYRSRLYSNSFHFDCKKKGKKTLCQSKVLHLEPQLNQFTYLTQFLWLCLFYITFYFVLYSILVFTL